MSADARRSDVRDSEVEREDRAGGDQEMSTLTRYSAIPYTGPAPTNREPYLPADAAGMDARGAEIALRTGMEQEKGQDLPTLIVPRERILETLRALKNDLKFNLP